MEDRGQYKEFIDVSIEEITAEGRVTLRISEQLELTVENVTLYNEEDIDVDIDSPFFDDFNFTFEILSVTNESIVLQLHIDKPYLITNNFVLSVGMSLIQFYNIDLKGNPSGFYKYSYAIEERMTP